MPASSKRKCGCGCKQLATGGNGVTAWASIDCAIKIAEMKRRKKAEAEAKAERKADQEKRERLKRKSEWAADAQRAFNKYIRARDMAAGYGCISCGTKANVQYAAGHFRTVAAAPQLRYSEDNVHLQCNMNCNSAKAGNLLAYRAELVRRIGLARVEALESDNTIKKYSIDDLRRIRDEYKAKLKALRLANGTGD